MVLTDTLKSLDFLGEFTRNDKGLQPYGLIPNAKHPKVIIPLRSKKNLFISAVALYQPSLASAKLLKMAVTLAVKCGLSSGLIRSRLYFHENDHSIRDLFHKKRLHYAISTGAEGPHRKVTIQVMDDQGEILGYIKVSNNSTLDRLLENEEVILKYLSECKLENALLPTVLYHGNIGAANILVVDTLKGQESRYCSKLCKAHVEFLIELFTKTAKVKVFGKSEFYLGIKRRYNALQNRLPAVWKTKLNQVMTFLHREMGETSIPFGVCHRDFTPWNTFFHNDELYVFDWEYAQRDFPPLLDLLHFIIQDGIIVRKCGAEGLIKKISKHQELINLYLNSLNLSRNITKALLLCYLLDISLFYMERENGKVERQIRKMIGPRVEMMDRIIERGLRV